jgi:hypothetical protein
MRHNLFSDQNLPSSNLVAMDFQGTTPTVDHMLAVRQAAAEAAGWIGALESEKPAAERK